MELFRPSRPRFCILLRHYDTNSEMDTTTTVQASDFDVRTSNFAIRVLTAPWRGLNWFGGAIERHLQNIITALVCLPWMARAIPQGGGDWAGLLLLGVVQLGLSYVLYTVAIKRVTAIEGVLIPVIEPIFNPLWAFFFVGESMGKWALIGGAILFAVVYSLLSWLKYRAYMDARFDLGNMVQAMVAFAKGDSWPSLK